MPLQSLLFTMNLFSNRVGKGGGIFALEGRDEVKMDTLSPRMHLTTTRTELPSLLSMAGRSCGAGHRAELEEVAALAGQGRGGARSRGG